MLYRFFFLSLAKCLHDFVFFFRRAWAQFYWLPRPREHNRVGSGLALRGSFIKCIFTNGNWNVHQQSLQRFKAKNICFLSVALLYNSTTVQWKFQPSAHLSTQSQYPLAIYECRAVLILVERQAEGRNLRHLVVRLYNCATVRKQMYLALE